MKIYDFFTGYQYGYGLPGMPAGFNPFLLNPGWLDAAYMTYTWPDYFRTRTPLVKGKNRNFLKQKILLRILFVTGTTLPSTNGEFYIPPQPQFHPQHNFLPPNGILPQLSLESPLIRPTVNPLDQLSLRISPVSNSQSPTAQETKIHSTVDQSNSENSEDEDIDVVKSAFVPIKPANLILQEVQPDSTVQDKELKKVDLKAPSSKSIKNLVEDKSPNTKIHHQQEITATKSVWRPY